MLVNFFVMYVKYFPGCSLFILSNQIKDNYGPVHILPVLVTSLSMNIPVSTTTSTIQYYKSFIKCDSVISISNKIVQFRYFFVKL